MTRLLLLAFVASALLVFAASALAARSATAQPGPDPMTTEAILLDHLQHNRPAFDPTTTRIAPVQLPLRQWALYDVTFADRRDHTLHYFVHNDGRVLAPALEPRERLATLASEEGLPERPEGLDDDKLVQLLAAALVQGERPVTTKQVSRLQQVWATPRFEAPVVKASPGLLQASFWTTPEGRDAGVSFHEVTIRAGGKVTVKVKKTSRRLNPER